MSGTGENKRYRAYYDRLLDDWIERSQYAQGGGHFVTTYFSGVVDHNDHVWLAYGSGVELDNGTTGRLWADRIDLAASAVDVVARFTDEDYDGGAAATRRAVGRGSAGYVGTQELPAELVGAVELVLRSNGTDEFAFVINRTDAVVDASTLQGTLLVGAGKPGSLKLGPREVAVLCRPGS